MPMVKEKPGALLIDSIDRFELESDGRHLAVHGENLALRFHHSVFRELMAVLPAAVLQAERLLQPTPQVNFAMGCEGWELGAIDDGASLILTFRLQGGTNISFCLPREHIPPMVDALISAARLVALPAPTHAGGSLQ
jgi:hypothetical protein